jgi:hypothetical protein
MDSSRTYVHVVRGGIGNDTEGDGKRRTHDVERDECRRLYQFVCTTCILYGYSQFG